MQETGIRRQETGVRGQGTGQRVSPPCPGSCFLAPRDLYRLRRASLAAREAALRAQMAQQQLEVLTLELERRYDLLGRKATVDARTGTITVCGDGHRPEEATHEP